MLNTVERGDFCLLFPTLTLTNGALMQVKRPLGGVTRSGETHCFSLDFCGLHWLEVVFRMFLFIIVDLCVSILLPTRHLWRNPCKQNRASCQTTVAIVRWVILHLNEKKKGFEISKHQSVKILIMFYTEQNQGGRDQNMRWICV